MNFSGLTDLAKGKKAWLSSESKWSKPNDAWRAMDDDGQRDFSFHTGQEDNPWWLIDLTQVYRLFFIVVGNRRKTCQELAGTLTVEVSDDLQAWETIHTGQVFWDGDLTFPLMGYMSARYVKLSLRAARTCFHLAKVEIWGTDKPDFEMPFPWDAGGLVPVPAKAEKNISLISEGKNFWQSSMDETTPILSGPGPGCRTREESGPWWMIDLEDIYPLESLTLKKPADLGCLSAARLKIEISRDGRRWSAIHEGRLHWSGTLHYPLQGEVIARYVRLSSRDHERLCFSQVLINSKKSEVNVMQLRNDGLGGRLSSLLNAMYLAKVLNCDFKFMWRARSCTELSTESSTVFNPSSSAAEDMFDPEFIKRHLITPKTFSDFSPLAGKRNVFRRNMEQMASGNDERRLTSTHFDLSQILNPNLRPDRALRPSIFFNTIAFQPEIKALIDYANGIELPDKCVAIHLRSGDIVYDINVRENGFTFLYKAAPVQFVRQAIEKFLAENRPILLFGTDITLLEFLARAYNVDLAFNYWRNYDLPEDKLSKYGSIFDMTLMARARYICANRGSVYPQMAHDIGAHSHFIDINQMFSPQDRRRYCLEDLKRNSSLYPDLQNAYSYGYLYNLAYDEPAQNTDELIHWLEMAASFDPEATKYPILLAAEHCKARRFETADQILLKVLDVGLEQDDILFRNKPKCLTIAPDRVGHFNARFLRPLEDAASLGYPGACCVMSIISAVMKENDSARAWKNAALKAFSARIPE